MISLVEMVSISITLNPIRSIQPFESDSFSKRSRPFNPTSTILHSLFRRSPLGCCSYYEATTCTNNLYSHLKRGTTWEELEDWIGSDRRWMNRPKPLKQWVICPIWNFESRNIFKPSIYINCCDGLHYHLREEMSKWRFFV